MPVSLRYGLSVLLVAGAILYWFYLRAISAGSVYAWMSFAGACATAGLFVLWKHRDPYLRVWEDLGAAPSWRRRRLEDSPAARLEAAAGEGDYTEAERWLAKMLVRKTEGDREKRDALRVMEKAAEGGGTFFTLLYLTASSGGWDYLKECFRRGSSLEGGPIHLLEEEAGITKEAAESFYQAAREGHREASYREKLVADDRFDALYANTRRVFVDSCRGNYQGIRGAPNWHFTGLARDIGRNLGGSEMKRVFELIDAEGVHYSFDGPPLGALRWLREEMRAEGYEPSVFAVGWGETAAVISGWGLPLPFFGTHWEGSDKVFPSTGGPRGSVFGLPFARETGLTPGRIYCIDFKRFCAIRYRVDPSLDFTWYKRIGSDPEEITFAAFNPCDVRVKDPAAARYIEPRAAG